MSAAGFGHLAVAKLLIETYRCDVNEEDSMVSAKGLVIGCVSPGTRVIHSSALAVNHGD